MSVSENPHINLAAQRCKHRLFGKRLSLIALLSLITCVVLHESGVAQVRIETYQPLGPTQEPFGYGKMDALWPKRVGDIARIPMCWEQPLAADKQYRDAVEDAVRLTWVSAAAVEFTGYKTCEADNQGVRIRVADEGPHVKWLGRNLDGVQSGMVLNFMFRSWGSGSWCAANSTQRLECIRAVAVHEFGHALGLAHEQNRSDTPGECLEPASGPNGTKFLTPWDPDSVMNYCHPIYRTGGWQLSRRDILSVQIMYGLRP